eukprot:COSAG06_NODE_333_length_17341_cov_7.601032_6_plen_52_part_00
MPHLTSAHVDLLLFADAAGVLSHNAAVCHHRTTLGGSHVAGWALTTNYRKA